MNDDSVALALAEIQQQSIVNILADHVISMVDDEPQIARVDRDEADGSVIVYFALENHSYFLAVQVDPLPAPKIRGVSIAAGNECYLVCFSTAHPLSALLAATRLIPTEQWDLDAGGGSSGVTIKTPMPLADGVEDNISVLLNVLEQDAAGIRLLASLSNTFIQAHWYGPSRQLPSIRLKPATLQRMAALNIALDLDLYVG